VRGDREKPRTARTGNRATRSCWQNRALLELSHKHNRCLSIQRLGRGEAAGTRQDKTAPTATSNKVAYHEKRICQEYFSWPVFVATGRKGLGTHVHHERAKKWFAAGSTAGTAFRRVTQMGFLRLLTNPRAMDDDVLKQRSAKSPDRIQRFAKNPSCLLPRFHLQPVGCRALTCS
jgi:hypothetical protein